MPPQAQGGDPLQEAMMRRQGQGQPQGAPQAPLAPQSMPVEAAPPPPMPPQAPQEPPQQGLPFEGSEAIKIIEALNGRLKAISKIQELQVNPLGAMGGG